MSPHRMRLDTRPGGQIAFISWRFAARRAVKGCRTMGAVVQARRAAILAQANGLGMRYP